MTERSWPQLTSPATAPDVLYAGSVFCDLVFSGVPHLPERGTEVHAQGFTATVGASAVRAVAGARLGASTALLAVLGTDLFGDHVVARLAAEPRLDLGLLRRDPTVHTPVTVAVSEGGDRSFITYREPAPLPAYPDRLPPPAACQVEVDLPLPDWALGLRRKGTLLVGGIGWDAGGTWPAALLNRIGELDVFCANAVEAVLCTGAASVPEALDILTERVPVVVVTDGPNGAVAADARTGERVSVAAPKVEAVDPTGAGDVFMSTFILGTLHGWPLCQRLRTACLAGALSVRGLGGLDTAPTWDSIAAWYDTDPSARTDEWAFLGTLLADRR